MGYWGYKAMESDSALDYMHKITLHLEVLWNEATDYGEKMAIVYILTEAPDVDMTDYNGLKSKAATYVSDYAAMLDDRNIDDKKQNHIDYLQGLVSTLRETHSTTLLENLDESVACA